MIHYAVTGTKRRIPDDYLALQARELAPRMRVVDYDDVLRSDELAAGTWIFADVDGLTPSAKEAAADAASTLEEAGQRVLNHPGRVLERFALLHRLHAEGINDFRVLRPSESLDDLRYPVFVRGASDHLGPHSDLIPDRDALQEALVTARAAAIDPDDLMVVEFADTRADDGLFSKYGTYRVGDRIVPQHLLRSDAWMIKHRGSLFTVDVAEREGRFVRENPHEAALRRVFDVAGVDFGRVDYSVDRNGRVQVWEINLCPMFARGRRSFEQPSGSGGYDIPPEARAVRARTKEVADPLLIDALAALDPGGSTEPRIPWTGGAAFAAADEPAEAPRETGGGALMTLLRAKSHFRTRW